MKKFFCLFLFILTIGNIYGQINGEIPDGLDCANQELNYNITGSKSVYVGESVNYKIGYTDGKNPTWHSNTSFVQDNNKTSGNSITLFFKKAKSNVKLSHNNKEEIFCGGRKYYKNYNGQLSNINVSLFNLSSYKLSATYDLCDQEATLSITSTIRDISPGKKFPTGTNLVWAKILDDGNLEPPIEGENEYPNAFSESSKKNLTVTKSGKYGIFLKNTNGNYIVKDSYAKIDVKIPTLPSRVVVSSITNKNYALTSINSKTIIKPVVNNATSYEWSLGTGSSKQILSRTSSLNINTVLNKLNKCSQNQTIIFKAWNTCYSATRSFSILINSPSLKVTNLKEKYIMPSGAKSFVLSPTVNNADASSYQWKIIPQGGPIPSYPSVSTKDLDVSSYLNHSSSISLEFTVRPKYCGTSYKKKIDVYAPLSGGSIGTNRALCNGTTSLVLGGTSDSRGASGSNEKYSYQWQSSTNGSSYDDITNETKETYSPGKLTTTKWYRRKVTSMGQIAYASVKITVRPQSSFLTVTGLESTYIMPSGAKSFVLSPTVNNADASSYQWKIIPQGGPIPSYPSVSTKDLDVSSYLNHSSSISLEFTVRPKYCGTSYKKKIDVYAPLSGGSIGTNRALCNGTTSLVLGGTSDSRGASGSNEKYSYQWQSSTNGSSYDDITNETKETYSPGKLTTTKWYRRKVTSMGQIAYASVKITVRPELTVTGLNKVYEVASNKDEFIIRPNVTNENAESYRWKIISGTSLLNKSLIKTKEIDVVPYLENAKSITIEFTVLPKYCGSEYKKTMTVNLTFPEEYGLFHIRGFSKQTLPSGVWKYKKQIINNTNLENILNADGLYTCSKNGQESYIYIWTPPVDNLFEVAVNSGCTSGYFNGINQKSKLDNLRSISFKRYPSGRNVVIKCNSINRSNYSFTVGNQVYNSSGNQILSSSKIGDAYNYRSNINLNFLMPNLLHTTSSSHRMYLNYTITSKTIKFAWEGTETVNPYYLRMYYIPSSTFSFSSLKNKIDDHEKVKYIREILSNYKNFKGVEHIGDQKIENKLHTLNLSSKSGGYWLLVTDNNEKHNSGYKRIYLLQYNNNSVSFLGFYNEDKDELREAKKTQKNYSFEYRTTANFQ